MNRTTAFCFAALAALWPALAQAQTSMMFSSTGPNLATPGAPFEAVRVTKVVRIQADGSTIEHSMQEHLYRDSEGRVLDLCQTQTSDHSGVVSSILIDPVAGRTQSWNSKSKTGLEQPLQAGTHVLLSVLAADRNTEAQDFPKSKTTETTEDLGKKTIAGVETTGKRTLKTVSANAVGNSEELKETQELWTSDELHMAMEEDDRGPVTGIRTVKTVSLQRGEPAASLFQAPSDVTLKPMKTISLGSSGAHAQSPAYAKAVEDLHTPEKCEAAAAVLLEYAKEHPETGTHITFLLAKYNTHLQDAVALGHASVQRIEQMTAAATAQHVTVGDAARMVALAEAWNALGWALWKSGEKSEARRYCEMSWALGGEGDSMRHVAAMSKDAGQQDVAEHQYQLALGGKMISDQDKGEVKAELAKMGVADPYPLHEPPVITLPSQTAGRKTGMYWLEFSGTDKPKVSFATGDDALALMGPTIAAADFPRQMPDNGPEHVLRRAVMVCDDAHCKLVMSYAADIQLKPKLSEPATTPPSSTPDGNTP